MPVDRRGQGTDPNCGGLMYPYRLLHARLLKPYQHRSGIKGFSFKAHDITAEFQIT
jgi:hypothetical protein